VLATWSWLAMALAPAANAHAVLVRSAPVPGSSLSGSPAQIRLWFDEPLRLGVSTFRVDEVDGARIPVLAVLADPADPGGVGLRMPSLDRGVYSVSWSIVSGIDTHVTEGLMVFGVDQRVSEAQAQPASVTTTDPAPPPPEVALRWLDLLALATVIGGLAVALIVVPAGDRRDRSCSIHRRSLILAGCSGVMALGLGIVGFLWQVSVIPSPLGGSGSWWDVAIPFLFHGRWATLWWMRELALAIVVVGVVALARGLVRLWPLPVVGTIVVIVARALGGHAASTSPSTMPLAIDVVHVLAAGLWVGGLIALTVASWPMIRRRDAPDRAATGSAFRRFGWLAGISVGVVVATGCLEAARQVASLDALAFTRYGQALMVKTAIVASVATIGLVNMFAVHPGIRARTLDRFRPGGVRPRGRGIDRRLLAAEAALGVAVLIAAGVMTSSSPARGPRFAPATEPPSTEIARQAGDLLVAVRVTPNLPGTNVVAVRVESSRRPAPAPIQAVALVLGPSPAARMRDDGAGRFQSGVELTAPGSQDLRVTVHRPGLPDAIVEASWVVGNGAEPTAPRLSDRPIGGVVTAIGFVLLLVTTLGVGIALVRRRRPGVLVPEMLDDASGSGAGDEPTEAGALVGAGQRGDRA
jgi:copper transport protein